MIPRDSTRPDIPVEMVRCVPPSMQSAQLSSTPHAKISRSHQSFLQPRADLLPLGSTRPGFHVKIARRVPSYGHSAPLSPRPRAWISNQISILATQGPPNSTPGLLDSLWIHQGGNPRKEHAVYCKTSNRPHFAAPPRNDLSFPPFLLST